MRYFGVETAAKSTALKPNTCPRFRYPSSSKMAKNVFSVPIFIIVFRETLEAAIIISVLLSLVEQLITSRVASSSVVPSNEGTRNSDADSKDAADIRLPTTLVEDDSIQRRRVLRRMRIQVNHRNDYNLSAIITYEFIRYSLAQVWVCSLPSPLVLRRSLLIATDKIFSSGIRFIAVWFTKASDLWAKAEDLWEGKQYAYLRRRRS